jgi:hypothetical protein
MPKRENEEYAVVAVAGGVAPQTRVRIWAQAQREGVSPSKVIGRVLDEFARTLPAGEVDPRQMTLPGVEVAKVDIVHPTRPQIE